jgi:hypothetical protein
LQKQNSVATHSPWNKNTQLLTNKQTNKLLSRLIVTDNAALSATDSFVPYFTENMHQICLKFNSAADVQDKRNSTFSMEEELTL